MQRCQPIWGEVGDKENGKKGMERGKSRELHKSSPEAQLVKSWIQGFPNHNQEKSHVGPNLGHAIWQSRLRVLYQQVL